MPYKNVADRQAYQREYQRKWREQNPDKDAHIRKAANKRLIKKIGLAAFRELNRQKSNDWRKKNPARWKAIALRARKKNGKQVTRYRRWKKYGLTEEAFELLFTFQRGCCAICSTEFGESRTIKVDHCHGSKRVRGLLCSGCNSGLGHFKDNEEVLMNAINYLRCKGDRL